MKNNRSWQFTFKLAQVLFLLVFMAACANSGIQTGQAPDPHPMDKSSDATLQSLLANVAPLFRQDEFNVNGKTMSYNLFVPEKLKKGKKYPLVLFMGDASTVGSDVSAPLRQGYGALVFASSESQARNPCFVLVPQFSGVAVNDAYQTSPEVAVVPALLAHIMAANPVDSRRVYVTGQSMGGMLGMDFMVHNPDLFAAGLFVDSHWNLADLDQLVEQPFIFVYAGNRGKSYAFEQAIEEAARKMSRSYTWAEWSARLPLANQDELASTMLGKGNPINLFGFENDTVLPENGGGNEHMYSFDKAYQLVPLREWLFGNSLK